MKVFTIYYLSMLLCFSLYYIILKNNIEHNSCIEYYTTIATSGFYLISILLIYCIYKRKIKQNKYMLIFYVSTLIWNSFCLIYLNIENNCILLNNIEIIGYQVLLFINILTSLSFIRIIYINITREHNVVPLYTDDINLVHRIENVI